MAWLFPVWHGSVPIADRTMVLIILAVALVEPMFQLFDMLTTDTYSFGTILSVMSLVYLFNIAQLSLYRWFDFLAMFALRLCHYLIWYIAWGHWRLDLLH